MLNSIGGPQRPHRTQTSIPTADVTLVLTSCGRQDLLERTLDSILAYNTYPIYQFIVIEDGEGNKNRHLKQKYKKYPFLWLATGVRVGQVTAIDIAYSAVSTEFIFHCEDDWEFTASGFIEKSICLLNDRDDILQVWLRALADTNGHPAGDEILLASGIPYRLMRHDYATKDWGIWHGFTWNPGLRRRRDYELLGSFGSLDPLGQKLPWHIEREASEFYRRRHFYAAILADNDGRGYLRHLGDDRHVLEAGIRHAVSPALLEANRCSEGHDIIGFTSVTDSPTESRPVIGMPTQEAQVSANTIPILAYHSVANDGPGELRPWRISPMVFEEQLKFLRDHGYYSVSLADWADCITNGTLLQGRPVVITFDDGYKNFIMQAAPLLEAFGFRATVFVVTERVGQFADWDSTSGPPLQLMSWDDLRVLEAHGFEIGSHTPGHVDLTTLADDEIVSDSYNARATLRRELGHDVVTLAFPGGQSDARVRAALASGGYRIGVEIENRHSTLVDDISCLPRVEIFADDDIEIFSRKLAQNT